MDLAQEILNLIGLAASEVGWLTSGDVKTGATLSAGFIAGMQKVLALHAKNAGKPIADVIAEL